MNLKYIYIYIWASLVVQMVKNLSSIRETWVQSLGWEDPLENGMATHSSILAWRSPSTEEPDGLQFWGHKALDMTEQLNTAHIYIYVSEGFPGGSEVKASASNERDPSSIPGLGRSPGEGNGNPLQYSCLENPMDRGAW